MEKIKLVAVLLLAVSTTYTKVLAQITGDTTQTGYIILAEKEALFGKYNYISGNVGVRAAHGRAEFSTYDILDPYEVRARFVYVARDADVNNIVRTPAGCNSLPQFHPYNGNTRGLRDVTVRVNGTLNGNWKNITVKRGVTVTVNGNNFGKITIERGANVTFTATVINVEELNVEDGKTPQSFTVLNFNNEAAIKVKDKVTVEAYTRVNVGGPEIIFYVGNNDDLNRNNGGKEKFLVTGEDNQVTANIIIPDGRLKVEGGSFTAWPTVMTGWYVIEKLDAPCKFVYWNQSMAEMKQLSSFAEKNTVVNPAAKGITQTDKEENFSVFAYPNPSSNEFSLQVNSISNEPVMIRIVDMNGKILELQTAQTKQGSVKIGSSLKPGIYIAEVKQGNIIKTVKLVKQF